MALPSSGSLSASAINTELGRGASASFSMNGSAERTLAAKLSGSISFADFLGKASEIVKTLAAGAGTVTLESLFTNAEWIGATSKRVVLASGTERGNSSTLAAAVSIGTTAWGGTLTFEVNGTVSGKGGAANSGVGGNAFNANRLGDAGQKINLKGTGVLRGGGGGGGLGGLGGAGSYGSTTREPASGEYSNASNNSLWTIGSFMPSYIRWAGTVVWQGDAFFSATQLTVGAYTYYRGAHWGGDYLDDYMYQEYYGIWRTSTTTVSSTGGAAGAGGVGEGYGQSRGSGAAGSAGGTNAGTGGAGGAGGLYGATGSTGSTGTNGNVASGLAGTAGGLAGYAIENIANVTNTLTGSLLGRT